MAKGAKTGGRTKGVPNKNTAAVKDAIVEAFELAGGVQYLLNIAQTDPKTFCQLIGKVIPLQVDATGLTITIARDAADL